MDDMIGGLDVYIGKELQDYELFPDHVLSLRSRCHALGLPLLGRIFETYGRTITYQYHELQQLLVEFECISKPTERDAFADEVKHMTEVVLQALREHQTVSFFKD